MKKLILSLSAAAMLVACGGGGPADDAQAVCDCNKKLQELKTDDPKYTEEMMKCSKMASENITKYKDDAQKMADYSKTLLECNEELMSK